MEQDSVHSQKSSKSRGECIQETMKNLSWDHILNDQIEPEEEEEVPEPSLTSANKPDIKHILRRRESARFPSEKTDPLLQEDDFRSIFSKSPGKRTLPSMDSGDPSSLKKKHRDKLFSPISSNQDDLFEEQAQGERRVKRDAQETMVETLSKSSKKSSISPKVENPGPLESYFQELLKKSKKDTQNEKWSAKILSHKVKSGQTTFEFQCHGLGLKETRISFGITSCKFDFEVSKDEFYHLCNPRKFDGGEIGGKPVYFIEKVERY